MKKNALRWVLLIVAVCLVLLLTARCFSNSILLSGMVTELQWTANLAPHVQVVETQSTYGKLNGNGNGIQYFGAILVTADNEEAVIALVDDLRDDFEEVSYVRQYGSAIDHEYLSRTPLSYRTSVPEDDRSPYYTVWFYNSHHPASNLWDIRGH